MELTDSQKRALVLMHFSGSLHPRHDGYYYRDGNIKADLRTIRALERRGLVEMVGCSYTGLRRGVVASYIGITDAGDELARQLLESGFLVA